MTRKPTASFRPRLETLEERWCPAKPGGGGALTNPAFAFIAPAQKSAELFVTTADGTATKQLTSDSLHDHSPSWSPDGTRIAFLRRPDPAWTRSDLYTIKPDGSGLTLVRDFTSTPGEFYPADNQGGVADLAWSPDGTKILYTSALQAHEALLLLDVATGAIQHLSVPGLFYVNDPGWSPDLDSATSGYQGMILFSAVVTSVIDGREVGNSDLFVLNVTIDGSGALQTGQLTNLTNSPGSNIRNEHYPEWSPAGASIVFSERNDGLPYALKMLSLDVSGSGLSITAAVTGTQVLVSDVHGNAEPTWSPDGQCVAFYTTRQVNAGTIDWDLYHIRPDGTQLTNVTGTDRRREYAPDWNPAWVNVLDNGLQAEATGAGSAAQTLTPAQVEPLLAEAVARWQTAGVHAGVVFVEIHIADLPGMTLGFASGNTIWLDADAAGWGWFVDPTPWDDSEFTTPGDQGEKQRMDLLTVLAHEIGHLLGLDHDDDGLMAHALAAGTRHMPTA